MSRHNPPEQSSERKVSRRNALKAVVLFGAVVLLIPVESLSQYLFSPKETGPVTYPRLKVANVNDLAVNDSIIFEYPHKDRPALLIHLSDGGFVAFDALCTHLGCQIHYNKIPVAGWESNPRQNFCPCHGGVFDPKTGNVLGGPPPRPQPKIKLEIDGQGNIFANGYESGLPLYGES
jgi:arsenite oxidase small subunit